MVSVSPLLVRSHGARDDLMCSLSQTSARSADQDPIRFRWLIPMSEAQVRATGGTGQ